MKINWTKEYETIEKDDAEVFRYCIECVNANACAKELKAGKVLCISLYTEFIENPEIKEHLKNVLGDMDVDSQEAELYK